MSVLLGDVVDAGTRLQGVQVVVAYDITINVIVLINCKP